MAAHPQRLALDFEIPAVLHRAGSQVTPRRDLALAIWSSGSPHSFARSIELPDERFERGADPLERGRAIFVQLAQQLFVAFAWWPPDHELYCRRRSHRGIVRAEREKSSADAVHARLFSIDKLPFSFLCEMARCLLRLWRRRPVSARHMEG